jgi:hypothetical protein
MFGKVTTGTATVTSVAGGPNSNSTPTNGSFGDKRNVTITVPGAVVGDTLILNQGADINRYIMAGYYITGAGVANVQIMCHSSYTNDSALVPNFLYTLIHPA